MTLYIELPQALAVIDRLGLHVRDRGLLDSALARPASRMFGEDTYPTLDLKAAALLSSLAQNHAMVDGNKRISLILTFVFLRINGALTAFTNDEAFDLVVAVAQSSLTLAEIAVEIAAKLEYQ